MESENRSSYHLVKNSKTKVPELILMSFDNIDHAPGFGSEESSSLWFLEELNRNEDPSRWMPDLNLTSSKETQREHLI